VKLFRSPLKPVDPGLYYRGEADADAAVRLRYLGTAGFVLEVEGHTLVIDPYLSRPSLLETAVKRLVPKGDVIRRVIPHADDVCVGHAHHDHVLDAPVLCQQTGARLIGSPDVCNVGRAAGLPEAQLVETTGHEVIRSGPVQLTGLPSRHGRVYFDRVTLAGDIPKPPPWPPRFTDLRHGLVLNWHIVAAGVRLVHVDSADFFNHEFDKAFHDAPADVLLLCTVGRRYRPRYVEDAVRRSGAKKVVAIHWDSFFTPYDDEPVCIPGVDLPGFVRDVERAGAEPIVLPFDGTLGLSPA